MFQRNIGVFMQFLAPRILMPQSYSVSTTAVMSLNQRWRVERGLPMNPNSCGILTDGPDYSFIDGRATPYGVRQRNRLQKQKEVAEQIIKLTGEIDFAVNRHKQLQLEKLRKEEEIISNKLKPKGMKLLKK